VREVWNSCCWAYSLRSTTSKNVHQHPHNLSQFHITNTLSIRFIRISFLLCLKNVHQHPHTLSQFYITSTQEWWFIQGHILIYCHVARTLIDYFRRSWKIFFINVTSRFFNRTAYNRSNPTNTGALKAVYGHSCPYTVNNYYGMYDYSICQDR